MGACSERPTRLLLKLLQLLSTSFVIAVVSRSGPQWILLLASLIVPPFGIFLLFRAPNREKQLLPRQVYSAVAAGRRWLRVDVSICLTMTVIFASFGGVLVYGHHLVPQKNQFLLIAAIGSIFTSLFYLLNGIVAFSQLKMGTIDFFPAIIHHTKLSNMTKLNTPPQLYSSTLSPLALHIDTLDRFHQSPLPYPGDTLLSIDTNKRRPVYLPPDHFENVSLPRIDVSRVLNNRDQHKTNPVSSFPPQATTTVMQNERVNSEDRWNLNGTPLSLLQNKLAESCKVYDVPPESRTISPTDSLIICRSLGKPFKEWSMKQAEDEPERICRFVLKDDFQQRRTTSPDEIPQCSITTLVSMNDYVIPVNSPNSDTYEFPSTANQNGCSNDNTVSSTNYGETTQTAQFTFSTERRH